MTLRFGNFLTTFSSPFARQCTLSYAGKTNRMRINNQFSTVVSLQESKFNYRIIIKTIRFIVPPERSHSNTHTHGRVVNTSCFLFFSSSTSFFICTKFHVIISDSDRFVHILLTAVEKTVNCIVSMAKHMLAMEFIQTKP